MTDAKTSARAIALDARLRRLRIAAAAGAIALGDAALTTGFWLAGEAAAAPPSIDGDAAIVYYTDDIRVRTLRVETAISLWSEGRVSALLMVGGFRTSAQAPGSFRMRSEAIAEGVAANAVFADARSYDTATNLAAARAAAGGRGWRSIVHVSDGMHLARIRGMLRRGGDSDPLRHSYVKSPYLGPAHIWRRAHYEAIASLLAMIAPGQATDLARAMRLGAHEGG